MNKLQVNKLLMALLVSALGMTAGMHTSLARTPTSDPVTSQAVNAADGRISGANDISGPVGRTTPPPQSSEGSSGTSGNTGNSSGRGGNAPLELGNGMINNGAYGASMPGTDSGIGPSPSSSDRTPSDASGNTNGMNPGGGGLGASQGQ